MLSLAIKNIMGSFIMNLGLVLYAGATVRDHSLSPLAGSVVRVTCNLLFTLALFKVMQRRSHRINLWGQKKLYLLIWGLLGTSTIVCYFNAVKFMGVATAGFMLNTSGSLLVLMSFMFPAAAVPARHLISALLCLLGAVMLGGGTHGFQFESGFHWGILAALSAAGAYAIVGRHLRHEAVLSTTFYWSLTNVVIHYSWISAHPVAMPHSIYVWVLLLGSGVLGAFGQYWVNASFQTQKSAMMGIISYLNCCVALGMDVILLKRSFSVTQYNGAAIIIVTSLVTLWLEERKSRALKEAKGPHQADQSMSAVLTSTKAAASTLPK